jgi:hypothetical protein
VDGQHLIAILDDLGAGLPGEALRARERTGPLVDGVGVGPRTAVDDLLGEDAVQRQRRLDGDGRVGIVAREIETVGGRLRGEQVSEGVGLGEAVVRGEPIERSRFGYLDAAPPCRRERAWPPWRTTNASTAPASTSTASNDADDQTRSMPSRSGRGYTPVDVERTGRSTLRGESGVSNVTRRFRSAFRPP